MHYPITLSRPWRWLFSLFRITPDTAFVELGGTDLHLRFGPISERIPLAEVAGAGRRSWPFYYGFGGKIGPDGGVSYVGSMDGVVRVDFTRPRPMEVFGPFRVKGARCVVVSVERADEFIGAVRAAVADVPAQAEAVV